MADEQQQNGQQVEGQKPESTAGHGAAVNVAETQLEALKDMAQGSSLSLKVVLDISMPVTVELGRTELTVQDLLHLRNGSVIELDKMAGEPVEIYVRDVCFARGEVVVVENNFGVRITQILNPSQALDELNETGEKENMPEEDSG